MKSDLAKLANKAYYEGQPIMTNEEYDALYGSTGAVGHEDLSNEIEHLFPMYSLQKYYVGEGSPPVTGDLVITPKLDGAAVSLLYEQGALTAALTRGDGRRGRSVFSKLSWLVPTSIDIKGTVQITGEVVAYKGTENARNFASGFLNLKNAEEVSAKKENVRFIAYGIEGDVDFVWYTEALAALHRMGFTTVDRVDSSLFPTDGLVYRYNSYRLFKEAGYTAKHPRGAYAEKVRDKPVVTKLLDVVWQTGKSGKITPVAILDPVIIDDAKISRATLNNMAYIEALGLEKGCMVEVIRAGKIIPCIVGRAD